MNSLLYLFFLSSVLGRRELDPTLLLLFSCLPGMNLGNLGTGACCPQPVPTCPQPTPAPPPTQTYTPAPVPPPASTQPTCCCSGTQAMDPTLLLLLFTGGFSGEHKDRKIPWGFRREYTEKPKE